MNDEQVFRIVSALELVAESLVRLESLVDDMRTACEKMATSLEVIATHPE